MSDSDTYVLLVFTFNAVFSHIWLANGCMPNHIRHKVIVITRKSKTEAVLQRRSMLKLGVICKFINRYGKCFMSWNIHLESQVLCLGAVIFCLFLVYWGCTQFRLLFAVCLVVYLNKHNIDNDVFVTYPGSFWHTSVWLLCLFVSHKVVISYLLNLHYFSSKCTQIFGH